MELGISTSINMQDETAIYDYYTNNPVSSLPTIYIENDGEGEPEKTTSLG